MRPLVLIVVALCACKPAGPDPGEATRQWVAKYGDLVRQRAAALRKIGGGLGGLPVAGPPSATPVEPAPVMWRAGREPGDPPLAGWNSVTMFAESFADLTVPAEPVFVPLQQGAIIKARDSTVTWSVGLVEKGRLGILDADKKPAYSPLYTRESGEQLAEEVAALRYVLVVRTLDSTVPGARGGGSWAGDAHLFDVTNGEHLGGYGFGATNRESIPEDFDAVRDLREGVLRAFVAGLVQTFPGAGGPHLDPAPTGGVPIDYAAMREKRRRAR